MLQGSAAHHHLLEKEVQQLTAFLDALPAHELNDKAGRSNLFFCILEVQNVIRQTVVSVPNLFIVDAVVNQFKVHCWPNCFC